MKRFLVVLLVALISLAVMVDVADAKKKKKKKKGKKKQDAAMVDGGGKKKKGAKEEPAKEEPAPPAPAPVAEEPAKEEPAPTPAPAPEEPAKEEPAAAPETPEETETPENPQEPATAKGKVVKVDDGTLTVLPEGKTDVDEDGLLVPTDDDTVVMVDGKAAKIGDIKEGMTVVLTPATGNATRVEATSPK